VVDLEGAPAPGRSAPPAGAPQHRWLDPSAAWCPGQLVFLERTGGS